MGSSVSFFLAQMCFSAPGVGFWTPRAPRFTTEFVGNGFAGFGYEPRLAANAQPVSRFRLQLV